MRGALHLLVADLLAVLALAAAGAVGAWWMRRSSDLSVRNLYPPAVLLSGVTICALVSRMWVLAGVLAPLTAPFVAGALAGRRWRLADLGAGEELRAHELHRRYVWQPARTTRGVGERVRLLGQGELRRERSWPPGLAFVAMSDGGSSASRVPLGAGQHVMLLGATGSGKTTSARRIIAARTLTQHAAVLVLDQKGDPEDVEQMRSLAAAAGVPFVLFDSQDPHTDRWAPLWGSPDSVAARAVEPIRQSEPYYYDSLRRHVDLVAKVLHAADRWPPSVPFLIDACHPTNYDTIAELAQTLGPHHAFLIRRAGQHARYVSSPQGQKDLLGAVNRLEVALALAGRQVVTPRTTPDGEAVAVSLPQALRSRAVVMWRLHADTMPDEAAALSVMALADIHEAAGSAGVPWTLVLDEFGAVIQTAAQRALATLQRGRSHDGQVIVITQSAADVEALTGQAGLLASLTDNFATVIAHRQTAPESRDWLAKLMGTRALWQHTNQTTGHGAQHSGQGSARRVREFRVSSDTFGALGRGEAVIYTPVADETNRHHITPLMLPGREPERIDHRAGRHQCETALHPEDHLAAVHHAAASAHPDADASAGPEEM